MGPALGVRQVRAGEGHPRFRPRVLRGEYRGAAAKRKVGEEHPLLPPGVLMAGGEGLVGCRGVQWDWEQGVGGKDPRKEKAGRESERRFDRHGRKR